MEKPISTYLRGRYESFQSEDTAISGSEFQLKLSEDFDLKSFLGSEVILPPQKESAFLVESI